MSDMMPEVTVIIPARDEISALGPLIEEIGTLLEGRRFELIVVDDGSLDGTPHLLARLSSKHSWLRVLRNDAPLGQSASIRQAVRVARAPILVTLDGDGQNPPDQIPLVLRPFAQAGAGGLGLVQGQRVGRKDTLAKRWGSRFANTVRNSLLRDGVQDSGCGLKAFRREAYLDLPWFDHIHRFMPAMMQREGWKVATVPVTHRQRVGGTSKYNNITRALVGLPDLLGAAWLIRRARPGQRVVDPSGDTRKAKELTRTAGSPSEFSKDGQPAG